MLKRHSHSHDTWSYAAVVGYLITDHGTRCGVKDQPDESFDTAHFDVCFIGGKDCSLFVRVCINKWFDTDGGSLAIIRNHLVRYGDVVNVLHGLGRFPERQSEINTVGQAERHDVCVVLGKLQRGCIFRQSGDVHLEEIDRELPVDVMKLVLVLTVVFSEILFIDLLEIVKIIRTFGIYTFMNDEVLAILLWCEGMHAVRAS